MSENVAFHNCIISVKFFFYRKFYWTNISTTFAWLVCWLVYLFGQLGFFMDSIGVIKGCMYDVVRSVPLMLT